MKNDIDREELEPMTWWSKFWIVGFSLIAVLSAAKFVASGYSDITEIVVAALFATMVLNEFEDSVKTRAIAALKRRIARDAP